jgi:hypothetical protein
MSEDRARGHILTRERAGENFLKLVLLDPAQGVLPFLLRATSRRNPAGAAPDLFDHAEVVLSPARGDGPFRFAAEYRVLRRHTGIGGGYERLEPACRLARLLARNPPPPDCLSATCELFARALEAFDSRPRPDITLLKALWCLARDGGWPVREHWRAALPPASARLLDDALRAPLDTQPAPAQSLLPLLDSLHLWLERECHFLPA